MAGANTKADSSRRSSAKHRNHSSDGAPVKNTPQNAASESAVRTFCYATQGHVRCAVWAFCLLTMHCLRWCIHVALGNPTVRYCFLGTSGIGFLFCCLEAYELISIIAGITVIRFALPHVLKRGRAEQDLKAAAKLANLEGDTTRIVMSESSKAEETNVEFASVTADSKETSIAEATTEQGSERASELSTTCDEVYAEQSACRRRRTGHSWMRSQWISSDSESPPTMSLAADVYQDTDCDASYKVGEPALAMTAWLRTGYPGQQEWQWTIMQPSSGNAEDLTPASIQTFSTGYRVAMKNTFLDECVAAPTAARLRTQSI